MGIAPLTPRKDKAEMIHKIFPNTLLRNTLGGWLAFLFGAILLLAGSVFFAGGIWLAAIGGSWYYAIAGLAIGAAGFGIMLGALWGIWIFLLTCVLTWIWAFWEVGVDGWALMPRVLAPSVFAILALLLIPMFKRARRQVADSGYVGVGHAGSPTAHVKAPDWRAAGVVAVLAIVAATVAITESRSQAAAGASAVNVPATTAAVQSPALTDAVAEDWPAYGGTNHALRYSALKQIDRDNVANLQRVWTYRTGDMPDQKAKDTYSPETTPIKLGDRMYLCSAKNVLISLDAATGKEWWRHDPKVSDDSIPYGATCRGVSYYRNAGASANDACAERILEATLDARLLAVDAKTGRPCDVFGNHGAVDLNEGIGETVPGWYGNVAAPTIVRNVIVLGAQVKDGQALDAPSGVIRGYDVISGKLVWAWDMGHPERTTAPVAPDVYSRGTPNMWTSAAGDDALGYVYVPLGNAAGDYWGAKRKDFENKYNSSVVAIDVTTGKEAWHFQTVHYDVWDYDLGSQPTLVDFPRNGSTVPALVLASKQGEIYVLDRRTGQPLFPVEERAAPKSSVEPDRVSPTQPYSGYHSVAGADLTERDMWGVSPLDQMWCRIEFHRTVYQGRYTPPSTEPTIEYPSYNGGSDWGSVAVDPVRGVLIVNYNNMANRVQLLSRDQADKLKLKPINVAQPPTPAGIVEYGVQTGAQYAVQINPGWRLSTGMMCTRPPYGGIQSVNLATGKTIWDEPLGEARENGPFGIHSMLALNIGTPNNGGALITAGGLIFIAAATDNLIRAIDIDTGRVVWKDKLPAGGQATPMTFEVKGRQYIGFMAGGHHFMHTPVGDYVLAYALPDSTTRK
jgi:quinoprotein glucose dehydrogenase